MKISDVMSREFEIVAADATVDTAAKAMAELDVVVLPVSDGERVQGILTERDLTVRVVAAGADPTATRIADVMSTDVFTCGPDDSAEAIAGQMRERRLRQVLVLDDGKLVGMVTLVALNTGEAAPVLDPTAAPRTPDETASQ